MKAIRIPSEAQKRVCVNDMKV